MNTQYNLSGSELNQVSQVLNRANTAEMILVLSQLTPRALAEIKAYAQLTEGVSHE